MAEPSDWQKGGVRYARLKDVVPAYLAPEPVEGFFVAVEGRRWRLVNPLTPFRREFVIAATPAGVTVLKLKLPGVFRASIDSTVFSGDPRVASWDGRVMSIDAVTYQPIHYHESDAGRVARLLSEKGDDRGRSSAG